MVERVAIVGARDASPETLTKVRALVASLPEGTIVISGGAKGVDSEAEDAARKRGLGTCVYFPKPTEHRIRCEMEPGSNVKSWDVSRRATPRDVIIFRNTFIAIACDRMVAFVEGSRGGTLDAIEQAKRFRRPVEVVR